VKERAAESGRSFHSGLRSVIPGTTNSMTTEGAPRALRGNLTHESPDTVAKMSHIEVDE